MSGDHSACDTAKNDGRSSQYYDCYNMAVKETVIRSIGNSQGATIPKAMLERLHLQPGDRVHLIETDSGILISPYDPDFDQAMQVYEKGARKYRNALKELAK